jgi:inner membrane protein
MSDTPAEPRHRPPSQSEEAAGEVAAQTSPSKAAPSKAASPQIAAATVETPAAATVPDAPAAAKPATDVPPDDTTPAEAASSAESLSRRRALWPMLAAVIVIIIAGVATVPFWAPPVMQLLPWGPPAAAKPAAPKPSEPALAAKPPPAPTAPDPEIAALRAQAAQSVAAVQQLGQRLTALEGKPASPPPPDIAPLQQQLTALAKQNADLKATVAALQKAVQSQPASDPKNTALALVLLQIRDAVDLARPFQAEYQALQRLAQDHPEIMAAARPLAEPAKSGVASRTALAARLRELAPRIAAAKPPPNATLKSQIVAQLRALVTIRRIEGTSQSPAEAAVSGAERDMAAGDLAGAAAALEGLSGAPAEAAEPWLRTARQRLAVEAALHRLEAAVTAALGSPPADKS